MNIELHQVSVRDLYEGYAKCCARNATGENQINNFNPN